MRCARTSSYVVLACLSLGTSLSACTLDTSPTPNGVRPFGPDSGDDGEIDGGPGRPDGSAPDSLLDGEPAEIVGTLMTDEGVASVQLAGEHVIALLDVNGLAVIDLADPKRPRVASLMATVGRAVRVRYDTTRQTLFVLTVSGDLRAFRLSDPSAPVRIAAAQIAPPDGASSELLDFARIGNRLFVLSPKHVVPVDVAYDAQGKAALTARDPVSIDDDAERIEANGTGFFVAFDGGVVRSFTAAASPASVGEVNLGNDIRDWSVRGQRIWVALKNSGLREVLLRPGESLDVEHRASELNDVTQLARSGQVLATLLARGRVAVLDVSQTDLPRGVAVLDVDEAPAWIAVAGGNLVLGSGHLIQVVAVPPIVESGVPAYLRDEVPTHGRTSLRFSKPLDPDSVTVESVVLRCDDNVVSIIPQLDLEATTLALLPTGELAPGASCEIRMRDVRDELGLNVSALPEWLSFEVSDQPGSSEQNGRSTESHTAEGRMTGWTAGAEGGFEYFDIKPVRGMSTDLYADYDGERLWLFFDALGHRDVLYSDCAAVFTGFAGSGPRFTVELRGDQKLTARGAEISGGYAFGPTRGSRTAHAAFELAIEAEQGGFAVQAYLPSPGQGCETLDREPIVFNGMCDEAGCSVDASGAVDAPATPRQLAGNVDDDGVLTLRFTISNALMSLPEARIEVSTQGGAPHTVYRTTAYGTTQVVPPGILQGDESYDMHVVSQNVAGNSPVATNELSIAATCTHLECLPGQALGKRCSSCAEIVCGDTPACCMSSELWDSTCIELAAEMCECEAPVLTGLDPMSGSAGAPLMVTVAVAHSAPELAHALVLSPEDGSAASTLDCVFDDSDDESCAVEIPATLPASNYSASLRVSSGGADYTSEPVEGGFLLVP